MGADSTTFGAIANPLAAGSYTLRASYAGDATYSGSTAVVNLTVNKKATSITGLAAQTITYGDSMAKSATVDGGPSGATLTYTLASGHGATTGFDAFTEPLNAGNYTLKASYAGNSNYLGSSATANVTVNKKATSITGLAAQTITYGDSVNQVATVSGGPGSETVTYTVASGFNATTGFAALTNPLDAGQYTLKASYAGNSNYEGSSAIANLTVNQKATSITGLVAQTLTYGDSVAQVAVVSGGPGNETITYRIAPGHNATSGFAAFTNPLNAGDYTLKANYAGNNNYFGSEATANVTVNKKATSITGLVDQTITYGDLVAQVAAVSGGPSGAAPTYTLAPNHNAASGFATFTTPLNAGNYTLKASYAGNSNYLGSSATANVTVNKKATSIANLAAQTITYGDSIGKAASVSGGPGSETVTYTLAPNHNATTGFNPFTDPVNAGNYTLKASYAGDNNYAGSEATANVTVNKKPTSITGIGDPQTITYGQSVAKTAAVTGGPNGATPSYTIASGHNVDAGSNTFGTFTNPLNAGNYTLKASYAGNSNYEASDATVNVTVNKASTSTAVARASTSSNPSVYGEQVTFTATVSVTAPGSGTPAGTDKVEFFDGTTSLGKANLVNGSASVSISALSVNAAGQSHSITAKYLGDGNFNDSTSPALSHTVNKASTTTAVSSSQNPSTFGQSVTFTAAVGVVSPGAGTPTGTVQFKINNSDVGSPVSVSGGQAQIAVSTLPASTTAYAVTAVFSGDGNFNGSNGGLSGGQTVNKATTTPAVTVTPNRQQYSDLVTFEATLSPAAINSDAPATGVTFLVGGQVVNATPVALAVVGGVLKATLSGVQLLQAPGLYTVTAQFSGVSSNFTVGSPTTALTITQEDATATYSGATYFATASPTSTTATLTLSATVVDAADGARGDVRNAKVEFHKDSPTGTLLGSANLNVGLVNLSDSTVGTATTTFSYTLQGAEVNSSGTTWNVYTVVKNYYAYADSQPTAITITIPGADSVNGGGFLVMQSSNGQYAGLLGSKMNFGYTMKYNNSGRNLQGQANIIVRASDGKIYQIKSNAVDSLAVIGTSYPKGGTFITKANMTDITNPLAPIALGGNLKLQVEMTDAASGGQTDKVGITLWNSAGGLFFSSNWDGTKTMQQLLGGGNISVR